MLFNDTFPLSHAYAHIFRRTLDTSSSAAWLSLPAILYTTTLQLRITTQRFVSLCASGLLPHATKIINGTSAAIRATLVALRVVHEPLLSPRMTNLDDLLANNEDVLSVGSFGYNGTAHPHTDNAVSPSGSGHHTTTNASHSGERIATTDGAPTSSAPKAPLSPPLIASHPHHPQLSPPPSPHKASHSPSHHPPSATQPGGAMSATSSTNLFTISPVVTTLFVGFWSLLLCILLRYRGSYSRYTLLLLVVYCTLLLGVLTMFTYVQFRKKFDCLETFFANPGRSYTAVYGGTVFSVAIMFTIIKQQRDARAVIGMIFYVLLCTVYYFYSARRSQCFSEEEQKVMFVAYVINANIKSKLRRQSSMAALRRENSLSMLQRTSSFNSLHTSRSQKTSHSQHTANGPHGGTTRSTSPRPSGPTSSYRLAAGKLGHLRPLSPSTPDSSSRHPAAPLARNDSVTITSHTLQCVREQDGEGADATNAPGTSTTSPFAAAASSAATADGAGPVRRVLERQNTDVHYPVALLEDDAPNSTTTSDKNDASMAASDGDNLRPIVAPMAPPSPQQQPGSGEVSPIVQHALQLPFGRDDSTTEKLVLQPQVLLRPTASDAAAPPVVERLQLPTAEGGEGGEGDVESQQPTAQQPVAPPAPSSSSPPPVGAPHEKRASFLGWMISGLSRNRIYTIADDEHEADDRSSRRTAAGAATVAADQPATSQGGDDVRRLSDPSPVERRLSDAGVRAAVQDRLRELGHLPGGGADGAVGGSRRASRSSQRGSFTVPQPTKYYRHSLGEVVVVRRRSSTASSVGGGFGGGGTAASSSKNSAKNLSALFQSTRSSGTNGGSRAAASDWQVEDVDELEAFQPPASRKQSRDHTASRSRSGSTTGSAKGLLAALPRLSLLSSGSHRGGGSHAHETHKASTVAVTLSHTAETDSTNSNSDVEAGAPASQAPAPSSQPAQPSREAGDAAEEDQPVTARRHVPKGRRASVQGLLRRSMHQLTQLATQLLPMVADDVSEFEQYTQAFVETMLQDMGQLDVTAAANDADADADGQQAPRRSGDNGDSSAAGNGAPPSTAAPQETQAPPLASSAASVASAAGSAAASVTSHPLQASPPPLDV